MRAMRVVHYVRVSTDEQGKTGYSVREQLHTLGVHSRIRGDEVVEEIADEAYSGASPERPGLARVMELAESGAIDVVRAVKRDRLFRSRLYRLLAERDLQELEVTLEALNDTGHRIGDGVQDDFAEWEREEITRRTLSGKIQKAREGKIIAGRLPVYGFAYTDDRNHYVVDEAKMVAVRRIFDLVASGESIAGTIRIMDAEGFAAPQGKRWQRPTVREIILDDSYLPHTPEEVGELVSPAVHERLTEPYCGIWYYNRRESVKTSRGRRIRKKPREEWVAVPVPDAGVPRPTVVAARKAIEGNERPSKRSKREWELSGGSCVAPSAGARWWPTTPPGLTSRRTARRASTGGITTSARPTGAQAGSAALMRGRFTRRRRRSRSGGLSGRPRSTPGASARPSNALGAARSPPERRNASGRYRGASSSSRSAATV